MKCRNYNLSPVSLTGVFWGTSYLGSSMHILLLHSRGNTASLLDLSDLAFEFQAALKMRDLCLLSADQLGLVGVSTGRSLETLRQRES